MDTDACGTQMNSDMYYNEYYKGCYKHGILGMNRIGS